MIDFPNLLLPKDGLDLKQAVFELERDLIFQAMDRTRGNKAAASRLLGVTRPYLWYRMKVLGLLQVPKEVWARQRDVKATCGD
jgi:DNA-binding NtrC family response regulator